MNSKSQKRNTAWLHKVVKSNAHDALNQNFVGS